MRHRLPAVVFAATAFFTAFPALAHQEPTASPAPAPVYMEVVPLRFTDPVAIAQLINAGKLPEGTTLIKPDPKTKRALRVVGTQEAIDAVKDILTILDVAPRKTTLQVIIERVRFDAGGKKRAVVVGRKTMNAVTNAPSAFTLTDSTGMQCAIAITPRLSQVAGTRDTMLARMGVRKASGASVGLERAAPLPATKEIKRVIGVTFVDDPAIVGTVGVGNIPAKWKDAFTAYYASVQVLPLASPKKP